MLRLGIVFTLLAFIALAVETAVPYWFPLRILVPNLIVILAVDLGLRHHGAIPVLLAFAMGYATDAFGGTMLGSNAMLMTIVYLLAYAISTRLMVTTAFVGAVMVFVGVMVATLGMAILSSGLAAFSEVGSLIPRLMLQAFISALLAPPIFAFLSGLKRVTGLPAGPARD